MANKQINQLTSAPSIDPSSDFVLIQKADGGTYKVTVDELVNASSKVSSSTQLGAPEIIHNSFSRTKQALIQITNMFSLGASAIIHLKNTQFVYSSTTKGREAGIKDVAITKAAGTNILLVNGEVLNVGSSMKLEGIGFFYSGFKGQNVIDISLEISCTKDSLTLGKFSYMPQHYSMLYIVSGQANPA